jgi:GNAT superfamily N-acetyltransferase
MHDRDILALYDRTMRADPWPSDPLERIERGSATLRIVGPGSEPGDNTVEYSTLDQANADAAIKAEIAVFAALGHGFNWKLYGHDRPVDLEQSLLTHGFSPEDAETLMALDLTAYAGVGAVSDGITLRRIADRRGLDEIVGIENEVWGGDHERFAVRLARELARDENGLAIYVAEIQSRPVATGWIRFHGDRPFASLWGGSTLQAWRGRGIYRALVAERAALAIKRGVRFLTVDASADSHPILDRLGFRALTSIREFTWRPGA